MDPTTDVVGLALGALATTCQITLIGAIGALLLGTLVTVARVSPIAVLRGAAFAYVQVFLNVPLLAWLLLTVFALPDAGLLLPLDTTMIVVIVIYEAAYVAEAVRSGINTVSPGQVEAARALGMSFPQVIRKVVVPQALRAVVQPLGNVFIALLMNSSLAATIGVVELTSVANRINNVMAQPIVIYMIVGLIYMAFAMGIGRAAGAIEKRVAILR